jgi:basic membrane protein A and related proteins
MTRLAALLATLVLALAACGGGDDDGSAATTSEQTEAIKVGLITDAGQLNDRGFNQLAYEGLKRAMKQPRIDGRVIESKSANEYVPNITSLVRQGYDLIIGVGFAQGDAINTGAVQFPDTKFVIIDVDQASLKNKPRNAVGMLFREEEAGYLAGYLAALETKRKGGKPVLGTVGGFKEPPVDRFIAGYQKAAKDVLPKAELLNAYSSDWEDQAKCKELALNQIARGAQVVFQVAGGCGLGALDAARERNIWGIGVDADQSFLGPHVLTSAMKRVDEGVYRTILDVRDGKWRGGRNITYGLAEQGVGLGTISPKVPAEDRAMLDAQSKRIAAGEIEIPRSLG